MDIKRVLKTHFLTNPGKEFHIRELARMHACSPSTITKYLEQLCEEDIIEKEELRGHTLYKATHTRAYNTAKRNHTLEQLEHSGIIEYVEQRYNNPEAIILFGSASKGEDRERSDIDIAIITANKEFPELRKFEEKLSQPIQILLLAPKDLRKNSHIANKLVNGIVLSGHWNYAPTRTSQKRNTVKNTTR